MSHIQSPADVFDISPSDKLQKEFSKTIDSVDVNDIGHSILKRSSKILEALYLVSNAIPITESIREEIRNKSLSLFSRTLSIMRYKSLENQNAVLDDILSLNALVQASKASGYVTKQTVEMVHSGLQLFYERISRYTKLESMSEVLKDMNIGHNSVLETQLLTSVERPISQEVSLNKTQSDISGVSDLKGLLPRKGLTKKGVSRSDAILDLIHLKQRVTVKDIQGVIKGFSQKTLQRELSALVSSGVLKKEGERRWSVYSLRTNGTNGVGVTIEA